MYQATEIVEVLKENLSLYQGLFEIIEAERDELRETAGKPLVRQYSTKKAMLGRLVQSLDSLAASRARWQEAAGSERARHPEVNALIRQNQDLLMKIIVLDRENEQTLLRQGRLATRDLPSANRQRPNFVAELYRRQGVR